MKEVQIIYDFDGTLTPKTVPFFPILQECGVSEKEFYQKIAEIKESGIVDVYESWFQAFLSIIQNSKLETHDVTKGAEDIIFNIGVEEWFKTLSNNSNTTYSHYIVTSGIEEFLYASKIAKYITKIFGVSFLHENGKLKGVEN